MRPDRRAMLGVAVAGYLFTAWAWALLGPLAPLLRDSLGLTPLEQALVVAIPVVVGALGRVPVGALADRLGGRVVFLLVAGATVVALLLLAAAGSRSVPALMIGAVLLGVAGTMFAAGVPFVSAWFPGAHRGLALGALGLGLGGGAIGGFTAVRLVEARGMAAPYLVTAVAVAVFGVVAVVIARDAPRRPPPAVATATGFVAALRLPITRQAGIWYGITFTLFVAFSAALPLYLGNAYRISPARAGDVMAAFLITAVLMRPVGGWLADRFAPFRPLVVALAVLAVATTVQASTPPLPVVLAGTLPALAVSLGVASTVVLAQVAAVAPPPMVGIVAGVVSAMAGLAGFVSPLLMAFSYSRFASYGPALGLLAAGAAVAAGTVLHEMRRSAGPVPGRLGPSSTVDLRK
jgi:NNP family nitrate/nitrite transporter-like MFS transporter